MEDLKLRETLPKFTANCNGHPKMIKVTVEHEDFTKGDAVEQAKVVDRFIKMKVSEKEERLNRFRKEVCQRVNERETRKQKLIGKHVRKVARKEARMVCQAQSKVDKPHKTRSGVLRTDVDDACLVSKRFSPKSSKLRHRAREQLLMQRKEDIDMSDLPGGWWGVERKNPPPHETNTCPARGEEEDGASDQDQTSSEVSQQHQQQQQQQQQQEKLQQLHTQQQVLQELRDPSSLVPSTSSATTLGSISSSDLSSTTCCESELSSTSSATLPPHVSCLRGSDTSLREPLISSSVRNIQKKTDRVQQYVTCRKVYAAVCREKVRLTRQHNEHRRAAEWLKYAKEQERMECADELEPSSPAESFTSSEVAQEEEKLRHWQEAMKLHEEKRRIQKNKETERYIDALKERIKERMRSQGVQPPPLCACHEDMWSSGPLSCANNCMFYNNPSAYARALASLLTSLEVL